MVEPQEVVNLLYTRQANTAPSGDYTPNDFLKAIGESLIVAIVAIATAC